MPKTRGITADDALLIAATIVMTFHKEYETTGDCFDALKRSFDRDGFELVTKPPKGPTDGN